MTPSTQPTDDRTDRHHTDDRPSDRPTAKWVTAAAAALGCVGMDCHGGPTSRVIPVETTDRYDQHARWDDGCHLLAGYSLGVLLGADGADRPTVVRRFVTLTAAWELLEYATNERPWDGSVSTRGAVIDTVMDTVMGTTGAFVAASHADR